jgi:hypothetical protein
MKSYFHIYIYIYIYRERERERERERDMLTIQGNIISPTNKKPNQKSNQNGNSDIWHHQAHPSLPQSLQIAAKREHTICGASKKTSKMTPVIYESALAYYA